MEQSDKSDNNENSQQQPLSPQIPNLPSDGSFVTANNNNQRNFGSGQQPHSTITSNHIFQGYIESQQPVYLSPASSSKAGTLKMKPLNTL